MGKEDRIDTGLDYQSLERRAARPDCKPNIAQCCLLFGERMKTLLFSKSSGSATVLWTGLILLVLLQPPSLTVGASSPEHLYLSGSGGSMYPTIGENDVVEVQTHVDPATVQVGDIIVYGSIAAMAYASQPKAMWICHRVVEKHEEGGTWHFRTKGDNNTGTDPWSVPAYWLLGVVTKIEHTSAPTPIPQNSEGNSGFLASPVVLDPFFFGGAIGLCIFIAGAVVFALQRTGRRENPRIFRKGICCECRRYEAEHTFTLEHKDGRLGLQKTLSSRGFCKYHNLATFDGTPESRCSHYEAREALDWPADRSYRKALMEG